MKGVTMTGTTTSEMAFSGGMFLLSIAISGAFGYCLLTDPTRLTEVWEWVRSLHIVWQGVLWLLFLPWMIALWIWTLPWATPVRIVLVIATVVWANWMLYPWKG